jgi:hypothetical protein
VSVLPNFFSNFHCPATLTGLCGKLGRKFDRGNHTRMFRESFACDVESSAVIDRSSDKGQSQSYVDCFAER